MAEAAAIALVGNILQFVEAGIKLTKTAQRAYKSNSGLIQEDEELLFNTQRLQTLINVIDQSQSSPEHTRQADIDESLAQTVKACHEYASQLSTLLDLLGRRPGEPRVLEAMRTGWQRRRKTAEIQALEGNLIKMQHTLLVALTTSSHSRQSSVMVVIRELKQQNAMLGANTTSKLESIESLIRGVDLNKGGASDATNTIISHLDNLFVEAQRVKEHQDVLKSLRFREIKQRHSAIQDHHKATFQWAFTKEKTGFREWLEEGSGFFWVKGKAGSGKSTLMKFIASHKDTRSLLRTWGGKCRVITASHFFWNAGLSMQKSLTGLFQTILYQVLRECPELIDIIKTPWQDPSAEYNIYDTWDDKALFWAFEQLSSQKSLPLRFCFFIDGLDEYTAGAHRYTGTFEELLGPLSVLVSSNSIKICVSSRPWDAFDRKFSHIKWKLQLEDLTREDIKRYVKEELGVNPRFRELSETDPRCSEIRETIVRRAQGVFLWVFLVVNSLKKGLLKGDRYSELQRRLDELPSDLQSYFEHMLNLIEGVYWTNATRIFRTVIAAEQALPLLAFDLWTDICGLSNTRLNAHCGDLLYVTVNPTETGLFKSQVDFLHRTVRDFFLDTGTLENMIQKRPTGNFDPHLSLCRIMLGLNKIIIADQSSSEVYNQLYIVSDGLMHYARKVEDRFTRLQDDGEPELDKASLEQVFRTLDELDCTNCEGLNHLKVHWTNIKDPPQGTFREGRNKTFLAATIQARLALYTAERLQNNPGKIRQKGGRPLLDYALRPTMITPLQIIHLEQGPVLPLVELLLDLGADPNTGIYIYENRTSWGLFLEMCYQHASQDHGSEYLVDDIGSAIEIMIQRGARIDGTFQVSQSQSLSLIETFDKIRLSQHWRSRIDEALEGRRQGRSFLSRMFGWN